jgi:hypothetical protein
MHAQDDYDHLRESADAGRRHRHAWSRMVHPITGDTYDICPCGDEFNVTEFGREGYLSLADELEPYEVRFTPRPTLADFDSVVVEAAREYATGRGVPFPPLDGLDAALRWLATPAQDSTERFSD